jgi:hypothetical protein
MNTAKIGWTIDKIIPVIQLFNYFKNRLWPLCKNIIDFQGNIEWK